MNKADFSKLATGITSSKYYTQAMTPSPAKLKNRKISNNYYTINTDDICLYYVNQGTGTLINFDKKYDLRPGTIVVQFSYQIFNFVPNANTQLDLTEVHFNNGTLMYLYACPYFEAYKMSARSIMEIYYVQSDEAQKKHFEYILQELYQEENNLDSDSHTQKILLLMELWGLMLYLCK